MDVTSQVKVKLGRQKGENLQYGIAGCDYSLGWSVLKVECSRTEHHHLSHAVYWWSLTKTWVDSWCLPLPWEWPVNSPLQLLHLKWKDILCCSFLITSHTEWPLSRCLTFIFIMMTTVQVLVVGRLDDSADVLQSLICWIWFICWILLSAPHRTGPRFVISKI